MEEEDLDQMLGFDEQIKQYQQIVFSQAEEIEKMKDLNNIVAAIYPQTAILVTQLNEHIYQLMFPLEIHGPLGLFQLEMQVDFYKNDIKIQAYFADQMGRMQLKNKLLRLQICRYMLRLNSNMRVGSFFINPMLGFLGYNLQCEGYKKKLIFQTKIDQKEFGQYFQSLILTAVHSFRFHFLRILLLINKIKIKDLGLYSDYIGARYSKDQNWRKLPNQSAELLNRVKDVVSKNMHLPFTNQEYDEYGPILSKQILTDQKLIQEIKPAQPGDLSVERQHKISEGGFCDIFAKEVFYTPVKEGNPQQVKRTLVIKQARDKISDTMQRIEKESKLLQKMAQKFDFIQNDTNSGKKYFKPTGCCPYIAQFYFSRNNADVLLMERYYHQSLDYYKAKMQEVMSLSTRLFIAHNIAMALRYCHYYGVVHMDIKPGNVLIAKNLMAKLTDFGEAHQIYDPITNQQLDQQNIKSGRTFPYCAPEITKQEQAITTAYDIYCFGVLLFELIFDRFPIDYRKANQKVYEERLTKQTYQVRYNEEYDKTLGPQKLMKYLGRMCLQCLQPNPAYRPHIDKIILVLKDCLTYLDKVY